MNTLFINIDGNDLSLYHSWEDVLGDLEPWFIESDDCEMFTEDGDVVVPDAETGRFRIVPSSDSEKIRLENELSRLYRAYFPGNTSAPSSLPEMVSRISELLDK